MNLQDVTNLLGITTPKEEKIEHPANPTFNLEKEGERKMLMEWDAPARPIQRGMDKRFMKTAIIVAVVISLLLIIMQEFLLILVIASIIFISYILSATPPDIVHYILSNHGIKYAEQFFYWSEMKHYFFTDKNGVEVLNIDVDNKLPGRLYLTLRQGDKQKVHEICGRYLTFLEEEPKTFFDNTYDSIMSKLDFESHNDK